MIRINGVPRVNARGLNVAKLRAAGVAPPDWGHLRSASGPRRQPSQRRSYFERYPDRMPPMGAATEPPASAWALALIGEVLRDD